MCSEFPPLLQKGQTESSATTARIDTHVHTIPTHTHTEKSKARDEVRGSSAKNTCVEVRTDKKMLTKGQSHITVAKFLIFFFHFSKRFYDFVVRLCPRAVLFLDCTVQLWTQHCLPTCLLRPHSQAGAESREGQQHHGHKGEARGGGGGAGAATLTSGPREGRSFVLTPSDHPAAGGAWPALPHAERPDPAPQKRTLLLGALVSLAQAPSV